MHEQSGACVEIVEDEVAIGDRVDRVAHRRLRLREGEGRARDRARAERRGLGLATRKCEARGVTLEHLDPGQEVMPERDAARFAFARGQAEPSPLGAGAVAGSTLPLPKPETAMRNTIDAVADRDFVLDYLYACAGLFVHLSRISEEICLWATAEFGFAKLPEDAATGSSMMPQKLNPDVAELTRGKAGTAIGRL